MKEPGMTLTRVDKPALQGRRYPLDDSIPNHRP